MLTCNFISRAAALGLAAALFSIGHPATAEIASDGERLEKLEKAVEQLQQRNTQLEQQVGSLKKQLAIAAAPAPPAEGPTKTKITSDGKSYVEKSVPAEKTAADKWKLSTPITELELYGDVRLRYEYRAGQTNDRFAEPSDDWQERERLRYRLRLGLRGTLLDDWLFGIRLETSQNPRSTNVTFADDTTGNSSATANGPFAKGSDGINVGQAYIGYKGVPDLTLLAGKMAQPLVTTRLLWDDDINPEGFAEQWKHTFKFGGGEGPASYSKDGKSVAPAAPAPPFLKLDLFANFGQFVYDDSNPENPIGPRATTTVNGPSQRIPNTDAYLLAWQVGAKANFANGVYAQLAPTLYNYTGNGDSFNTHFQGGDEFLTNKASLAQNQTGINSLLVFDMPMELGWKLWNLPMRIFGEFADNFEGDDRALAAGHSGHGDQRYAYEIGGGIGSLKKKGNWQVEAWWQHTEQYAVDPNLVDSDLFENRVNMEGVVVRAGYMFSDAAWLNLSWGYAWRADDSLGTGGVGDIGINPLDAYQIFQADFNLKF